MIAKKQIIMALAIAVLALGAGMALAQEDEGPILRPKTPPAKPATPMLQVSCNWPATGHWTARRKATSTPEFR